MAGFVFKILMRLRNGVNIFLLENFLEGIFQKIFIE